MPNQTHVMAIDWSAVPAAAATQLEAVCAVRQSIASESSTRERAYGDWRAARDAAAALFAAGIELRHVPEGGSAALALACEIAAELLDGTLPATITLAGDALVLAPLAALLRRRGVRVVQESLLVPGVASAARSEGPCERPADAIGRAATSPTEVDADIELLVAGAEALAKPLTNTNVLPLPCNRLVGLAGESTRRSVAGVATLEESTEADSAIPNELADAAATARSASEPPSARATTELPDAPAAAQREIDAAQDEAVVGAAATPTPPAARSDTSFSGHTTSAALVEPDAVASSARATELAAPLGGNAAAIELDTPAIARAPGFDTAGTDSRAPREPVWAPRAQPAALPRSALPFHVQRSLSAVEGPALDAKLRRRLREIVKNVYIPAGVSFNHEPRQRLIAALCRNTTGIDERWSDFPDEVARGLLGVHLCLYRHIQDRGIDHVTSGDLSETFDRLRRFSAGRYPGHVHGFRGDDVPLGANWLEDARLHLSVLEATTDAPGISAKPRADGALRAVALAASAAGLGVPADTAARPAVCANAVCARLAAELLGAGECRASATAENCCVCHGSNSARATLELAAALRAHGIHRLLIIGGDPAARQQLAERLAPYDVQLRGVDGEQPSPSEREALADRAWAELIVIWSQRLQHRVSGHYSDASDGALLVRVTRGGVTQLSATVRERLALVRASATG